MPINPNIAMGVQGVQLNNPLDAYAKMSQIQGMQNQNALAQYGLAKAQREDEGQNALALAVKESVNPTTGEVDVNALTRKLGERGQGGLIPKVSKEYQEAANAKTAGEKSKLELIEAKWKNARSYLDHIDPTSPNAGSHILNWTVANLSDPVTGPEIQSRLAVAAQQQGMSIGEFMPQYINQRKAEIDAAVAQGPAAVDALLLRSKAGVEKFIEMNKPVQITQDTGDGGRVLTRPGLGGPATVVEGSEYTKKLSAKERADLSIQQQRVALQREKLNRGDMSPEEELDFIRRKEAAKAEGKADAKSAAGAQTRADTAEDVLDLIAKAKAPQERFGGKSALNTSTGSGAGNIVDKTIGFFGGSTDASKAAAQLAAIGNRITLMGDKPAGSISNYEMGILSKAGGALQDPTVPNEDKEAALETVESILKRAAARGNKPVNDPYKGRSATSDAPSNRKPLSDILGQ